MCVCVCMCENIEKLGYGGAATACWEYRKRYGLKCQWCRLLQCFCHGCFFSKSSPSACILVTKSKSKSTPKKSKVHPKYTVQEKFPGKVASKLTFWPSSPIRCPVIGEVKLVLEKFDPSKRVKLFQKISSPIVKRILGKSFQLGKFDIEK